MWILVQSAGLLLAMFSLAAGVAEALSPQWVTVALTVAVQLVGWGGMRERVRQHGEEIKKHSRILLNHETRISRQENVSG